MNRSLKAFLLLFLVFAICMAFSTLFPDYALFSMAVNALAIVGVAIFMYRNHRCPSCKRLLMAGNLFLFGINNCPHCGTKLKE